MNLKRWDQQRYQKLKELTRKYLDTSAYFCLHGEQRRAAVLVLSFQAAARLEMLTLNYRGMKCGFSRFLPTFRGYLPVSKVFHYQFKKFPSSLVGLVV